MRVKDLVSKDFENTNVKKLEADKRLAVYRRKIRSLEHQKELIVQKVRSLTNKLVETGKAYPYSDPRFNQNGSWGKHVEVGTLKYDTIYVPRAEANQPIVTFLSAMRNRRLYLDDQISALRRSIKGTRSAITRKDRKSYWS